MITRLKLLPHRKLCALDRRTAAAKSIILRSSPVSSTASVLRGSIASAGIAPRFATCSWTSSDLGPGLSSLVRRSRQLIRPRDGPASAILVHCQWKEAKRPDSAKWALPRRLPVPVARGYCPGYMYCGGAAAVPVAVTLRPGPA